MKPQTIVVGIDGSDGSQRALDAAIDLVETSGTIHVVSAYDAPSNHHVAQAYASVPAEFIANVDVLAQPRALLDDATNTVTSSGLTGVSHFVDADPASAILDIAEDVDADLVVVGSRGLGRASQVLRGSVSTKIAHHCRVDFLVVH